MKYFKQIPGIFALVLATASALAIIQNTQAADKESGKRKNYYWIKYDCSGTNPQPVNGPNNYRQASDSQNPYTEEECADEVSKCAVKFDIPNTQSNPSFPNSKLPINPSLELQLLRCPAAY